MNLIISKLTLSCCYRKCMLTSLFVFLLLVISTANHHSGGNMISKILKEKIFEPFVLELGLHQLISEQTHYGLISLISLWNLVFIHHFMSIVITEIGICLGNRSQNINFIASVTTNSFIFINSQDAQDDMIKRRQIQ